MGMQPNLSGHCRYSLVPTGKLLLVNERNHTCRMHLLHLRSVKWGPPLSKVGTCSKFSLFRKRGIFRQLARFIYQPFNVRRPNLTLLRISHAFRNLL